MGITSCNFQEEEKKTLHEESGGNVDFLYDLTKPDSVYQLPSYLREISGISYFSKDKIACIQDEKAKIYIFDTKRGEVTSKIDFGKDGDYEDISIVKNDAYLVSEIMSFIGSTIKGGIYYNKTYLNGVLYGSKLSISKMINMYVVNQGLNSLIENYAYQSVSASGAEYLEPIDIQ